MIEIKNLWKTFGDKSVLKGIDLKIEKGKVFAIIGPSGTGKSTLLKYLYDEELVADYVNGTGKIIKKGIFYEYRINRSWWEERIDGAVALVMALDRAIRHEESRTDSVYNDRGIIVL